MSSLFPLLKSAARAVLTLLLLLAALWLVAAMWQAYVLAPWTRDGRVSAQVVRIAPEVNGTVIEVAVADDQYVKRGEILFRIDPKRFRLALEQAEAQLAAASAALEQKRQDASRRKGMDELVPREDIHRANQAVAIAEAEKRRAQVARDVAQLDLDRTTLRAPVDGFVTHLRLRRGDYAVNGRASITLLDASSFWVTAYFEETKLLSIRAGEPEQIKLMGCEGLIQGHVASIGHGITDSNEHADALGLPSVEPSFSWIRLAQRIPVHIEIDQIPEGIVLAAGMTCSIDVGPPGSQGRLTAWLHRWM